MSHEPLDDLERLIAHAQSEDEVTEIMKLYDEKRQAAEEEMARKIEAKQEAMAWQTRTSTPWMHEHRRKQREWR